MRRKLFKRSAAIVLMLMVLSTGLVANAEGTYTVEKGDYLKKIAQATYGDSARWEDIYEANKASIKNPNILYKGQVLILPDIVPAPVENPGDVVPVENPGDVVPVENPGEATPAENPEQAGTVMTLEQWTASEECKYIEEYANELMSPWGLNVVLLADGNTLVFGYTFSSEIWGDFSAQELAASVDESDLNAFTESMRDTWTGLQQEFASTYGIQLDGYRVVYVAPDGIPFYSTEIKL